MLKQLIVKAAHTGILLDGCGQILTQPGYCQYPDRVQLAHQVRELKAERWRIAAYFYGRTYSLDELMEITGYRESVV